jgi:hypothetical protein
VDIDYSPAMTETKCYTCVIKSLLAKAGNLSFLIHCCNNPPGSSRRWENNDLPSWAIDLRDDVLRLPRPRFGLTVGNPYHRLSVVKEGIYEGYAAAGDSHYLASPSSDHNDSILELRGMAVGRITVVGRLMGIEHQLVRPFSSDMLM